MSIDYSVHVGPYIKCLNFLTPCEIKLRSCTNADCKEYKQRVYDHEKKFCSSCGSPIEDVIIQTTNTRVNTSELQEELHETVCQVNREYPWKKLVQEAAGQGEINIWISNSTMRPNGGCRFDPKSDFKYLDMTDYDIVGDLEGFTLEFKSEIAKLKEVYGEENVQIKWGVFNWAN